MDLKLLFALYLITLVYASKTFEKEDKKLFHLASSEDYYDYHDETDSSEENNDEDQFRLNDKHLKFEHEKQSDEQTEIPEPKYEVTEIVDDIPNNTTVTGPVFANFTIAIPLNNVTIANVTNIDNAINGSGDKVKPSLKRNYVSIFHFKAEYDDNKPDITVIQNNRPNFPGFQGFRDYLKGVRQGIINGIQNFVNNNNNNNAEVPSNNANDSDDNAPIVHNIVNAPVVFWNKLRGRNSDVTARRNVF